MPSKAEQCLSRSLRAVLANLPNGASIPESEQFRWVLSGLEYFVPEILAEIYPEWNQESLDGVLPLVARKTEEGEAEIFGLCIIMSGQTVTPLHMGFQVAASTDEVSWLECKVGEKGANGMVRTPYQSQSAVAKRLHALEGRADLIDWVYKVTFGHQRH